MFPSVFARIRPLVCHTRSYSHLIPKCTYNTLLMRYHYPTLPLKARTPQFISPPLSPALQRSFATIRRPTQQQNSHLTSSVNVKHNRLHIPNHPQPTTPISGSSPGSSIQQHLQQQQQQQPSSTPKPSKWKMAVKYSCVAVLTYSIYKLTRFVIRNRPFFFSKVKAEDIPGQTPLQPWKEYLQSHRDKTLLATIDKNDDHDNNLIPPPQHAKQQPPVGLLALRQYIVDSISSLYRSLLTLFHKQCPSQHTADDSLTAASASPPVFPYYFGQLITTRNNTINSISDISTAIHKLEEYSSKLTTFRDRLQQLIDPCNTLIQANVQPDLSSIQTQYLELGPSSLLPEEDLYLHGMLMMELLQTLSSYVKTELSLTQYAIQTHVSHYNQLSHYFALQDQNMRNLRVLMTDDLIQLVYGHDALQRFRNKVHSDTDPLSPPLTPCVDGIDQLSAYGPSDDDIHAIVKAAEELYKNGPKKQSTIMGLLSSLVLPIIDIVNRTLHRTILIHQQTVVKASSNIESAMTRLDKLNNLFEITCTGVSTYLSLKKYDDPSVSALQQTLQSSSTPTSVVIHQSDADGSKSVSTAVSVSEVHDPQSPTNQPVTFLLAHPQQYSSIQLQHLRNLEEMRSHKSPDIAIKSTGKVAQDIYSILLDKSSPKK